MSEKQASRSPVSELIENLKGISTMPRALWWVIGAFSVDAIAYFGILTLMTEYLSTDLGLADKWAHPMVSVFTMLVTLFMLGVGSWAEKLGLKRAIVIALAACVAGRTLYCLLPGMGAGSGLIGLILLALLIVAMGEGILQPSCYAGVKQYTTEKTSSMGYALIYAVMNLCVFGAGFISSELRPAVQKTLDGKQAADGLSGAMAQVSGSGIQAVNWVCLGITALTLVLFLVLMTRRAEAAKLRPDDSAPPAVQPPLAERFIVFFRDGPFSNGRFVFFIFMLLPVRTLFALQWLVMPQYILRAYSQPVADRMEILVNWINPLIIFFGVPLLTAVTRRVNIYTMMIVGTLVSAAPTFLLCGGPNLTVLIIYFVVFSIGEALWSARFLEYASELAPPGRVAQYMGLAQVPWLMAKGLTGFYSGWLLELCCPKNTPPEYLLTGWMWLFYGCLAMTTPIGLVLARKWVMAGLHPGTGSQATS